MSEQPDRHDRWVNVYSRGRSYPFEDQDVAERARIPGGKTVRRVDLFEGESIIGPEERAVIEAAKAQAEAWPAALASIDAVPLTTAPFVRWERLAHATEAAVRVLKEMEKSQ